MPTKMFTLQIYGLEELDEKIFTHVKNKCWFNYNNKI